MINFNDLATIYGAMTMREAAIAAMELAAKEGKTDTRILEIYVRQAQVYALLAIADALETR